MNIKNPESHCEGVLSTSDFTLSENRFRKYLYKQIYKYLYTHNLASIVKDLVLHRLSRHGALFSVNDTGQRSRASNVQ